MEQRGQQDNQEVKQEEYQMKKRTNLTTKVITLMIAMVLVASLFPKSVMAASTKGPSDGFCFIRVEKSETERIHIFFPQAAAAGTTVEKVSGFSYDKKTNTLTIKNVKQPKWVLNVNEMGSDYNHGGRVQVRSQGWKESHIECICRKKIKKQCCDL